VKHSGDYDRPQVRDYDPDVAPCLEAQIADFADEIAYNCHDIDDGLQSGLLRAEQMEEVALWREHYREANRDAAGAPASILRYQPVRRILDAMVSDLVAHTEGEIARHAVTSIADLRAVKPRITGYGPRMAERVRELKSFLMDNLYMHVRVTRMGMKAKTIISG